MNAKDSVKITLAAAQGDETKDHPAKRIFQLKPILANILKYAVSEYKDMSIKEIMDCIEGDTIQTGTALVSEDMANTIRGENTETRAINEASASFDVLFRSLLPKSEKAVLFNLHIDFEVQGDYQPGYPVIKRGIYYACRKLSAQLPKIDKKGIGYRNLEKVYSIWVCLTNIPEYLKNTTSFYRIENYRNDGFANDMEEDRFRKLKHHDLLEVVIIRLGEDSVTDRGAQDMLYGVFTGDSERVLSYFPEELSSDEEKEVNDMLSIVDFAEKDGMQKGMKIGEERGRQQGENRLIDLIKLMQQDGKGSDVQRVIDDEKYRKKMFKHYNL